MSLALTKAALITAIAEHAGLTKAQATGALEGATTAIHNTLCDGGDAVIPGIGKLKVKQKAARTGRNPATGEAIEIAAKTTVKFAVAKELADALN